MELVCRDGQGDECLDKMQCLVELAKDVNANLWVKIAVESTFRMPVDSTKKLFEFAIQNDFDFEAINRIDKRVI